MPEATDHYDSSTREVLTFMYGDSKSPGSKPAQVTTKKLFVDGQAKLVGPQPYPRPAAPVDLAERSRLRGG
jgi:hypothetical protein